MRVERGGWTWAFALLGLTCTAGAAAAQEQPVREVGGRLIATGETVEVKGEADAPPRDSSIATKIDTPLIETPHHDCRSPDA
jgi:hypothetical protein